MKIKTCEGCCNAIKNMCIYNTMSPRSIENMEPVGFKCPLEDFSKKELPGTKEKKVKLLLKSDEKLKTQITDMYINKSMTIKEVADKLGISAVTVNHRMQKFGITGRSRRQAAAIAYQKKRNKK